MRIAGVEEKSSRWNAAARDLVPFARPREPEHGIFVREAAITCPLFRIDAFRLMVLCVEEMKRFFELERMTNITFLECGEMIP